MSECNIKAAAELLRHAGYDEMEELKISSKVLWRARMEVCQTGSHILDMVANGAWTWPRGDSLVHLGFL